MNISRVSDKRLFCQYGALVNDLQGPSADIFPAANRMLYWFTATACRPLGCSLLLYDFPERGPAGGDGSFVHAAWIGRELAEARTPVAVAFAVDLVPRWLLPESVNQQLLAEHTEIDEHLVQVFGYALPELLVNGDPVVRALEGYGTFAPDSHLLVEDARFFAPEFKIKADVGSFVSIFWQSYLSQQAEMGELVAAPHHVLTGTALNLLNAAGQEDLWE